MFWAPVLCGCVGLLAEADWPVNLLLNSSVNACWERHYSITGVKITLL